MCRRSRASMSTSDAFRGAEVELADAALVVGRDGHGVEDALDLARVEPVVEQALAGAIGEEPLGAGAGGHALGLDAGEGAGSPLGGDGDGVELVDLLRVEAGRGSLDGVRVASLDPDLGAAAALALAHLLGDVRGEVLGAERL